MNSTTHTETPNCLAALSGSSIVPRSRQAMPSFFRFFISESAKHITSYDQVRVSLL